jgi:hypothetical protein
MRDRLLLLVAMTVGVFASVMFGCRGDDQERINKLVSASSLKPGQSIYTTVSSVAPDSYQHLSVLRYEFDGHDYIMFWKSYDSCGVSGVVHDPDCKCGFKPENIAFPMVNPEVGE